MAEPELTDYPDVEHKLDRMCQALVYFAGLVDEAVRRGWISRSLRPLMEEGVALFDRIKESGYRMPEAMVREILDELHDEFGCPGHLVGATVGMLLMAQDDAFNPEHN